MKRRKNKGDVHWHIPKRKKPIAYSTLYASNLIVSLAQKYDTIQEIHDAINYDLEAKDVLKKYIDVGYGSIVAREIFR